MNPIRFLQLLIKQKWICVNLFSTQVKNKLRTNEIRENIRTTSFSSKFFFFLGKVQNRAFS